MPDVRRVIHWASSDVPRAHARRAAETAIFINTVRMMQTYARSWPARSQGMTERPMSCSCELLSRLLSGPGIASGDYAEFRRREGIPNGSELRYCTALSEGLRQIKRLRRHG